MDSRTILIIDDEAQLRSLLRMTLQLENFEILEAGNASDGIDMVARYAPDVVLLDLGLPDRSGHDVLKHLREWYTKPIIILSVQNTAEDIVRALDNGANDYLTKPFHSEELSARIRAAIRNAAIPKDSALIEYSGLLIDFAARVVRKNGVIVKLTATEYSLLALLIKNESKVLTHQYLLTQVWGAANENDTQYLRVFVGNLRKKIEDDANKPTYIITESGVGYRFLGNR